MRTHEGSGPSGSTPDVTATGLQPNREDDLKAIVRDCFFCCKYKIGMLVPCRSLSDTLHRTKQKAVVPFYSSQDISERVKFLAVILCAMQDKCTELPIAGGNG